MLTAKEETAMKEKVVVYVNETKQSHAYWMPFPDAQQKVERAKSDGQRVTKIEAGWIIERGSGR